MPQEPKKIEFEGQVHEFPSDFSDAEIQQALSTYAPGTGTSPTKLGYTLPDAANQPHMQSYQPGFWDRVKQSVPFVDRAATGLASLKGEGRSDLAVLAKPLPGMRDERALAPENMMTSSEQQAHPIATGAAEFAGGMTTPTNMLLTAGTAGPLPPILARGIAGAFATTMMKGAYDNYAPFKNAVVQKDWGEAERIGTHMVLGTTLALLGARSAIKGQTPYEEFDKSGREFSRITALDKTRNGISTNGVGLYNRVRQTLVTHQEALKKEGDDYMQDAIKADEAAAPKRPIDPQDPSKGVIPGGTISTSQLLANTAKTALKGATNFDPLRQAAYDVISNKSELTLQEAKSLRTALGRVAFQRTTSPEFSAMAKSAYKELGEGSAGEDGVKSGGIKGRLVELYGPQGSKLFDLYNNRFRQAFELENGVTGTMLEDVSGAQKDPSAIMKNLEEFSKENLDPVKQGMNQAGGKSLADTLGQSQKDAKALTAAHDAVSGKFLAGVYRMFMQNPKEAWPGIATMFGMHMIPGMPFGIPQVTGALVAAKNIARTGANRAADIGAQLRAGMPPEDFLARTAHMKGETFAPIDQDAAYSGKAQTPQSATANKVKAIQRAKQP
jgi:hypothetical protein